MKTITFIDTEVSLESNRILDFGAIKSSGETMHESSPHAFKAFIYGTDFLCGHNIIHHDLKFLQESCGYGEHSFFMASHNAIDTLYWSALLFPQYPYHALIKDDKLQTDELNNPLNDAKKSKDLFYDEVEVFRSLPDTLKLIYYTLLKEQPEFNAFFRYMDYEANVMAIEVEIRELFQDKFCSNANIKNMIEDYPIELAYCLALIYMEKDYSITPRWILKNYPAVDALMHRLRGIPCNTGCKYCNGRLDAHKGLKQFFGYDAYRDFDDVPLQEQAVKAAIDNKSLLAVFPTGGGKSITFQVPALMAGKNTKGLTVVISPLQSLMKDQVDNLERSSITDAVTINGLLDPIERAESIRRVENGEATMLYISPESLRSKTIERLLLGRMIARFVIDEAHCFSAWGQDFRVDYLYIADFIKNLCNKKNLDQIIPVSCFTATAKQNVMDDIRAYFKDNLNLDLELYTASAARKNLSYKVIKKEETDKYDTIRDLLEYEKCPTIIYVSRTGRAAELAERLNKDGYSARAYHGKMDKKEKSENQDAFIRGDINIMVATSAFGMGVDKKDVGMVIHYDISDSLENYVQEAGRAGRDESISAKCFVLFNDEDLNKHFLLLNQTKISQQEIQQVWKAIKDTTKTRSRMSNSALEIAREAGWDENVREIETRVKTAIAALEDAGYIRRGQNMPRVYADSIMAKTAMEAINKIRSSNLFNEKEEEQAIRIIRKLISSRSRKQAQNEIPESRVDYIADDLGLEKRQVVHIIQTLREAKVLADAKDLTAYMEESGSPMRALNILDGFRELERFLLKVLPDEQEVLNVKELSELAEEQGIKKGSPDKIRTVMNFWAIKGLMKRENSKYSKNHVKLKLQTNKVIMTEELEKRWDVAGFILKYLDASNINSESMIEFSVLELVDAFNFEMQLLQKKTTVSEMEDALFYLSRVGALKLEGGFLITYNAINIERLETDNKIRYKVEDYKNLRRHYEQKTQMIHIVGEYARKMMEDYQSALQFVDDYFQLEYSSFLDKYFKKTRNDEMQRNLTPEKFEKLFGELSPTQLKIINDKQSQYIVVAAGPGSGKTRILVHKLASLLLMEDVKHEQLLMITFSRAAATEFKKRLLELIGNAAHYVDIKTFHSYCFDLLGRVGNIEKSSNIIKEAVIHIENGEVEASSVTRTVLVIDEAQDMDEDEYQLIEALIHKNDDMRVIAVGDDDQNIYSFRGSDSRYMQELLNRENAKCYELTENYRSKANLVAFTNIFAEMLKKRLKKTPIMPVQGDNGSIKVIHYRNSQLIVPAVNKMCKEDLHGSTCVLTKTNEEALQVTTLLQKNGIQAKLIQSSVQYEIYNLMEIRYFIEELQLSDESYTICDEIWEKAKRQLTSRFANSKDLFFCEQLIRDFEDVNNKHKYKSDLTLFLQESEEEDFYNKNQGYISVATIHKSKGWEFDHVIILLSNFLVNTEEAKRQLYVGMTRAKKSLIIHYSGECQGKQKDYRYGMIDNLKSETDNFVYEASNIITIQLGYKDVYLSYFLNTQKNLANLVSGDELKVDQEGCLDQNDNRVLKFSKKFKKIISQQMKGYHLMNARVNHILYWQQEDEDKEILVLLPEVEFAITQSEL